jgi:hypothetical protein
MGNPGLLASSVYIKTAPCRHQKIGCSSYFDCLTCITYLKTYSLQVVQGRLFGMGQSKANQWIHVLLPALLAALRTLGDAPTRSLTALAQRLGVSEADAASVAGSVEEESAPVVTPDAPLLPMTGRNDASSAPKTLLNRPRVIAARKKTTP